VFSRFFIDRPIFASVLSIVITLAGALSYFALPIAQYPQISPPNVSVECNYPGASAQVVAETVAAPIEQQVNGVENMMYMASQCTNDGSYNLTITFKIGVDLNLAQVMVQNRVALALPLMPTVIKQTGVTTKKKAPDILMSVAIFSPDDRYNQIYLSNYAMIQIQPELARLDGVSDVTMLGQRDYSMRIWVDPDKMAIRNVTAGDVVRAIREQNLQVATGQIGQQPMQRGQRTQVTTKTLGRLIDTSQFGDIVVKTTPEGRYLKIKDIGRVELSSKNSDLDSEVDGKPTGSLAVFQLPDANALESADRVMAKMEELKKRFPEGLDYVVRYNTTPYIRESIREVFVTLRDAVILVALVVLLFLQNWRSAVIPLIAVPVAIIGTLAVMLAMGFSINNLTLFGLVLAIGIVVDDAIVVVEAVEHHIEQGMRPRAATIRAMEEVSAPVIAVGLVLSAVFVPCAFITGITGQFFRQFALTIASSTIISTFNSLTLSPALAAILLKPKRKGSYQALPALAIVALGCWLGYSRLTPRLETWMSANHFDAVIPGSIGMAPLWAAVAGGLIAWFARKPFNWLLAGFFGLFNRCFDLAGKTYTRIVGGMLRVTVLVLMFYAGMLALTAYGYVGFPREILASIRDPELQQAHPILKKVGAYIEKHPAVKEMVEFPGLPKGFIPSQDMGYLMMNVQLPDSASSERTLQVMRKMQDITRKTPGVGHTFLISGQSMLLSAFGSNFGSMFVMLDDFKERPQPPTERFFTWLANPKLEAWLRKKFHIKKVKPLDSVTIAAEIDKQLKAQIPEAMIVVLPPPPVRGVGRAGGFKMMIEDRSSSAGSVEGLIELQKETDELVDVAKQRPALTSVSSVFRANVPQVYVDLNRNSAMTKEVELNDIFDTLQIYLGSVYVNDFNLFGRTWQVIVQCDAKFRDEVEDIQRLRVRNQHGQMVQLGSLAEVKMKPGPFVLTRYNMHPASFITGNTAPGISSRGGIDMMEQMAGDPAHGLSQSMATEWTEMAYLELLAGNTAMVIFGFAVVMVFLVLAAQYESWSLPLAVILVVPMCLLSAIAGVWITKMDINIFTQIGFVVLVGLASKNAILIVEFAKVHRRKGLPIREATLEACRLRLRPIVMTSMAFILGVVPLLLSTGAGAEMRRTLGTAVFSGMLGVTAFGIFLTPVFFYVVDWLSEMHLFAAGPLRRVSDILLGIVSFSALRPKRLRQPRSRAAVSKPSPMSEELVEQK
jgi:multidrug efflux pump